MNKQRKVLITITYNEMGIIIDTKAEEVAQPNLQSTCNQLATDTINRQAAIETVIKRDANCGIDSAEVLKDLPSAHPEQWWIPCGERLPETNGTYNVTRRISDGFECQNITDACYFDGSNTWHDDTRVNHERKYLADVLAWMPLPEPYEEEE